MSTGTRLIDRLRRPEYTGENRCVPCTAVNVAIAVVLAAAIRYLLPAGVGTAAGAAVFLGAAAAIYLRGYLVPGTPWFTRTYFPDRVLRAFDKAPATPAGPTADGPAADGTFDVEAVLEDAGAVTDCDDVDDLCLTDPFGEAWREAIEDVRRADRTRRDLVGVLGDGLAVEERGDVLVAREEGVLVGQWESEAAFLADVAAARVLSDRYPAWSRFDREQRGALLNGLRLFVERCPSCDGPVTMGEEVVRSCCRQRDVVAVTCDDCGARLFEAEVDDAG